MREHDVRTVTRGQLDRFALRRGRRGSSRLVGRLGAGACALAIGLGVGASPALAGTSVSRALRTQARELYAPVSRYEHSTTAAQRARSRSAARHLSDVIDACDAPYRKRLDDQLLSKRAAKLYMLFDHATLLQIYRVEVEPFATHLAKLAASWAALSLGNRAMNQFVHAVAAELRATLDAPPFHSCGFVKAIAAHHFSYSWARRSADGMQAARWWKQISRASDRTAPFWSYVYPTGIGGPTSPKPGAHLFTHAQLVTLANLPGELG